MKKVECERFSLDAMVITIVPSGWKGKYIEIYEDAGYAMSAIYVTKERIEELRASDGGKDEEESN